MAAFAEEPVLEFATAAEWDEWLEARGADHPPVWLRLAKRGAPRPTAGYAEALDVALCHGWIDGQKRSEDAHFFQQRFSRRGPRSRWSQINVRHVERLRAAGRMRPGGEVAVAAAQADGRWAAAYAPPSDRTLDPEFAAALAAVPAAEAFFGTLAASDRYSLTYRIAEARRPETKAARIAEYVALLAAGRTLREVLAERRAHRERAGESLTD